MSKERQTSQLLSLQVVNALLLVLGMTLSLVAIISEEYPEQYPQSYNMTYRLQPIFISVWILSSFFSFILAWVVSHRVGKAVLRSVRWWFAITITIVFGLPSLAALLGLLSWLEYVIDLLFLAYVKELFNH